MLKFQIFGSADSEDIDIMVFVDTIPDKQHLSNLLCEEYNSYFRDFFNTDRKINCNLMVLGESVYKGTYDEVVNSLYKTYNLHKQYCDNMITGMVERDVELKVLRTCRVLLSFIARTEHRLSVKNALKNDVYSKIDCLKNIDLSLVSDLGNRNVIFTDYLKVMMFQLGQTIALMDGYELYTKKDIGDMYPDMKPFLARDIESDLSVMEKYKKTFIDKCFNFKFMNVYE